MFNKKRRYKEPIYKETRTLPYKYIYNPNIQYYTHNKHKIPMHIEYFNKRKNVVRYTCHIPLYMIYDKMGYVYLNGDLEEKEND
jgi:hypothetical protein